MLNLIGSQYSKIVKGMKTSQIHFFLFFATPHGMWDMSFLTRDRTHNSCSGGSES